MRFPISHKLLDETRAILSGRDNIYWLLGGSGSGKTTIARALSDKYDIPIYDMDAYIYGSYHSRFDPQRHPANTAWASAPNGLAWLLDLSWEEFNAFNQAALPEYLDLFANDLADIDPDQPLLIDGGLSNPALLAQVIPVAQILCLSVPHRTSAQIWSANEERRAMRGFMDQLPAPEAAWHKFLDFDQRITDTIKKECLESNIHISVREAGHTVDQIAKNVALAFSLIEA